MRLFFLGRKNSSGNSQFAGSGNFAGLQNLGLKLTALLSGTAAQTPGLKLSPTLTGTTPESVGLALSTANSGTVAAPENPALALSTVMSNTAAASQVGAAKITQIKYDLIGAYPATTAASTGTWTNANNATGSNNGTNATNANTLTTAASGTLTLSYAAVTGKTALTISQVVIRRYSAYTAGLVGPGTLTQEYSLDGGTNWTNIGTGSTSFTNNGDDYDITAAVGGDWSKLANFRYRFTFTAAASAAASTVTVDAIELRVTASQTVIQ